MITKRCASAGRTPGAIGADVKESDGYLYSDDSDEVELDEAISFNRHKQSVYRQRGEAVPIALTVNLERLFESKRIRGDQNFAEGKI